MVYHAMLQSIAHIGHLMISQLCKRVRNVFFPTRVRLEANFPWTWMKTGSTYLMANLYFAIGSFLVPLAIMAILFAAALIWPAAGNVILPLIASEDGTASPTFMTWMMVVSFLSGFGLEVLYIKRAFQRAGTSLPSVMGLTFKPLQGSNALVTGWNALWRVVVTYGIWLLAAAALSAVLPQGHQDTVDFARTLSGGNMLLFALVAAVAAPVFEELVFRGFLFQGLRSNFRQGRLGRLLVNGTGADFAAVVVSSAVFALMHMQWNPTTLLMLFLLGCFHAELYRRTGSLYCSMMLHALNNGLQVLLLVYGMQ